MLSRAVFFWLLFGYFVLSAVTVSLGDARAGGFQLRGRRAFFDFVDVVYRESGARHRQGGLTYCTAYTVRTPLVIALPRPRLSEAKG